MKTIKLCLPFKIRGKIRNNYVGALIHKYLSNNRVYLMLLSKIGRILLFFTLYYHSIIMICIHCKYFFLYLCLLADKELWRGSPIFFYIYFIINFIANSVIRICDESIMKVMKWETIIKKNRFIIVYLWFQKKWREGQIELRRTVLPKTHCSRDGE